MSMGGLLWYRVQDCGGLRRRLPGDNAASLALTARALLDFASTAGRFLETTKRREWYTPATFTAMLRLLRLVERYQVHRAINAVQCLGKAFQNVTSLNSAASMAA
ncbi:uncharacterized protein CTRU02_214217 [Colletotrichum truncatum]|uniref:Uncharacterized protein n=1 Tax=Colletotrichum truncatum TaxID=5467 RepID=A0ACC3YHZ5_COLTU|nr:uncharacterized protein CTRU02_11295 [Colletotrichum truncatum]KAF6786037.1 hypothetical protein CTRU02_11295 [Colletotrichum truncatum]